MGNLYKYYEQEKISPHVFNILGETLKVTFENEAVMFMEVIEMIPVTVAIMIEKEDSYMVTGHHRLGFSTNLMGNELNIDNQSKFKVVFKDNKEDDVYEWTLPEV
jgi:hypothetical protein